jgi:hypothetical protein
LFWAQEVRGLSEVLKLGKKVAKCLDEENLCLLTFDQMAHSRMTNAQLKTHIFVFSWGLVKASWSQYFKLYMDEIYDCL